MSSNTEERMRQVVDVLIVLAVLLLLTGAAFRFISPDMGFTVHNSFVTPLFLYRGAMGFLGVAAVVVLRQIRDQAREK
jgi:hypothetical protein